MTERQTETWDMISEGFAERGEMEKHAAERARYMQTAGGPDKVAGLQDRLDTEIQNLLDILHTLDNAADQIAGPEVAQLPGGIQGGKSLSGDIGHAQTISAAPPTLIYKAKRLASVVQDIRAATQRISNAL